jgi:hypothetical protein
MGRRPRSREKQLDLEWTAPLRWEDLPAEVRDELRVRLHELLAHAASATPGAEGGPDE